MTMYGGRRTQWRSLANVTVMAAAVAIAVPLIGPSGRNAPVPASAAATASGVEAPGSSPEGSPVRATQPGKSDQVSGRPAFVLYIIMEAARQAPMFSH